MSSPATEGPLAVLARIRRYRPPEVPVPGEHCDLCGQPVAADHGHLVDLELRSLQCACRACHLLFAAEGAGGRRFRAVPDRYLALSASPLTAGWWESLQIPVSVAFFFVHSALERVAAFYPGPAGATESLLPLDRWAELVTAMPALENLQPDVEALLVRADPGRTGYQCFVVPIDACYALVGQLRQRWRGFDGGREARDELDAFFADVRGRST